MRTQWWSPEVKKTLIWQATIIATFIANTYWPAQEWLILGLGVSVASILASLVPPRPTVRSLVLDLLFAEGVVLLGFLYYSSRIGRLDHSGGSQH